MIVFFRVEETVLGIGGQKRLAEVGQELGEYSDLTE